MANKYRKFLIVPVLSSLKLQRNLMKGSQMSSSEKISLHTYAHAKQFCRLLAESLAVDKEGTD